MTRNKVAAVLLIISAIIFISFVVFIEKVSGVGTKIGLFAVIATGALFLYLYWHRFSNTKRLFLLLFFVVPSVVIFLRRFFTT